MEELIRKKDALDALMAERKHLLANGQKGAEHILTHHGYNVIDELQPTLMRSIGKLVGYTGNKCPNCGRLRVERYESGLEICEKCNWCEQTKSYWLEGVF